LQEEPPGALSQRKGGAVPQKAGVGRRLGKRKEKEAIDGSLHPGKNRRGKRSQETVPTSTRKKKGGDRLSILKKERENN